MKPGSLVRFSRDPQVPGIESSYVASSRHVFPRHCHEDIYAMSLMEAGGSYWDGRGRSSTLVQPGELAVINPGEMHSGEPRRSDGTTYKMLYIDRSVMNLRGTEPQFGNVISGDLRLNNLFMELYEAIGSGKEPLEKETVLTAFTGFLSENYSYPAMYRDELRDDIPSVIRAREFMADRLNCRVTLEEAARVSGYSPYHFLRLFKKSTGMTPHLYLTQMRIDKARSLMVSGLSPSEVALETGFTDQSHFANTFRKYTGATPGQYFSFK